MGQLVRNRLECATSGPWLSAANETSDPGRIAVIDPQLWLGLKDRSVRALIVADRDLVADAGERIVIRVRPKPSLMSRRPILNVSLEPDVSIHVDLCAAANRARTRSPRRPGVCSATASSRSSSA